MLKRKTSGWMLVLALLLAGAAGAQQDRREELWAAASAGDVVKLKAMLDAGVDPNLANAYGGTALIFAARRGHIEAVKLLLERGANPNARDTFYGGTVMTPLNVALRMGHLDIAGLLIDKGAEGEAQALGAGATQGHAGLVQRIVSRNKVTPDQLKEALILADIEGRTEVVQLLRAAGVPPPVIVDAATLKSYEGDYEVDDFFLQVAVAAGRLTVTGSGLPLVKLGPVDETNFLPSGFGLGRVKIRFDVENGRPVSLTFFEDGEPTVLQKKDVGKK